MSDINPKHSRFEERGLADFDFFVFARLVKPRNNTGPELSIFRKLNQQI